MSPDDLRHWLTPDGRRKLLLRAVVGVAVGALGLAAYLALQSVELRPVIWLEPGALESAIPANAGTLAVCAYFSFYPLAFLPGLVRSDRAFRRYLTCYVIVALVSLATFALAPSGVSRESIVLEDASWLYRQLAAADQPRNAFPSLHASVSVLAGLALWAAVRAPFPRSLLAAWIAIVLWSTIATRQHVLVDLASGGALALSVWWCYGRRLPRGSE